VVVIPDVDWPEQPEEDVAGGGMSSSRKRKLADTPMVERPVCRFFMEGKCVKVNRCFFFISLELASLFFILLTNVISVTCVV